MPCDLPIDNTKLELRKILGQKPGVRFLEWYRQDWKGIVLSASITETHLNVLLAVVTTQDAFSSSIHTETLFYRHIEIRGQMLFFLT